MPQTEVEISELEEFLPSRVDGVKSAANGFPILMLKSIDGEVTETEGTIDDVLAELDKAEADAKSDNDRPPCPTCKGDGKIMDGHRQCPDCKGSGVKPQPGDTEKSLAELAARKESGVAPSGSGPTPADNCGTCNGTGMVGPVAANQNECPDCGGTGKDQATTNAKELNAVDADGGHVTEGAGGRETVDKSMADCDCCTDCSSKCDGSCCAKCADMSGDDAEKAAQSTADQNDLPDSDFAFIEKGGKLDESGKTTPRSLRHFPIQDAAHVRNALARASQSPFGDQAMPAIKAAAKKFNIEVSDATKAAGDVFSAANPALAATDSTDSDGASSTDGATANTSNTDAAAAIPGSPGWETLDAETATQAAMALMAAAELMRTFIQREMQEVAAGEGSDAIDAYAVSSAICGVNDALGVMAQMAFHEGLEAAKSLADDEIVIKAGRRLAGKTVAALATARDKAKDLADHIGGVLGDDDPAKKNDASKSADDNNQKDILDMTEDDLQKLVATTVAQAVVAAKSAEDELDKEDAPVKDASKRTSLLRNPRRIRHPLMLLRLMARTPKLWLKLRPMEMPLRNPQTLPRPN